MAAVPYLTLEGLKEMYNGKDHPDVRSGKLSEEDAFEDFVDAIEAIIGKNGKIEKEDFEKYYNYVSFCTPNDRHFEILVNRLWNGPKPLGLEAKKSSAKGAYKITESPTDHGRLARVKPKYDPITGAVVDYGRYIQSKNYPVKEKSTPEKGSTKLIDTVKSTLVARGLRGILGLYRGFRVYSFINIDGR